MCVKRALASSAALAASRGRIKTFGEESIAAMDRISLEHLMNDEVQMAAEQRRRRGVAAVMARVGEFPEENVLRGQGQRGR